jgi:tRNA(Arg) A34 adenosine deaminase TadA
MIGNLVNKLIRENISDFKERNNKNRHIAAIVYKNKIIAIGRNLNKTHPLAELFSRRPGAIYLHAEIDAIRRIPNSIPLKECSLVVIRTDRRNQLMYSKPCEGCLRAIKQYELEKVFYSTSEGGLDELSC